MYDMTKLKTNYFNFKLKNGKILDIEPPKLKILKKMLGLSGSLDKEELSEKELDNLIEAVTLAINKNKQGYKITNDQVCDLFNINELMDFLTKYFAWVNKNQSSKN